MEVFPYCFPQWFYQFTFPPTRKDVSLFSKSSPEFICGLINDGHSNWCNMVSHCSFYLHFSNNMAILSIFSHACWPSVCLLWWNVYLSLLPIFQLGCFLLLLLSSMSFLCILEVKLLSVECVADIFPNLWIDFSFFNAFLCCVRLLSLIRSHWFICIFIVFVLGGEWNKRLLWFMSMFCLYFPKTRSFIVSGFTFTFLRYFEFMFMYVVTQCFNFIL